MFFFTNSVFVDPFFVNSAQARAGPGPWAYGPLAQALVHQVTRPQPIGVRGDFGCFIYALDAPFAVFVPDMTINIVYSYCIRFCFNQI